MALKLIGIKKNLLLSMCRYSLFLFVVILVGKPAQAHHWFQDNHDINTLLTVEVEIIENRFINPHPFFSARLINAMNEPIDQYGDLGKEWRLQMDNRWELQELGFNQDTLSPGDKVIVTVHPGSTSKNILYVKALEHSRLSFRYEHNVRQLFKLP